MADTGFRFAKFFLLFASALLLVAYGESLDELYTKHVPDIQEMIQNLYSLLYEYEEKVSQIIIRVILLGRDVDHPNLIRIIRHLCLKIFFYIQICRILGYGCETLDTFWTNLWISRNNTDPEVISAGTQNKENSSTHTHLSSSAPKGKKTPRVFKMHKATCCRCRLVPEEFRSLVFENNKTPKPIPPQNETHENILKLFDASENQTPSMKPENNSTIPNDEPLIRAPCDDAKENSDYTGWSKEILQNSTPKNQKDSDKQPKSSPQNKATPKNICCAHCGCILDAFAPSLENFQRNGTGQLSNDQAHANADLANPVLLMMDVVEGERPTQSPMIPEPGAAGPKEEDASNAGKAFCSRGDVSRSASTPVLCTVCPRPARRFATTDKAELLPVCFKLMPPLERWPRTTYTLAQVK